MVRAVRVREGRMMRSEARAAQYPPAPPRPVPPVEKPADPELERILKMVEAGELSAKEADELLQALGRA